MNRLSALIAAVLLLFSVAAGSVLHAAEPPGLPAQNPIAADHNPGDDDQVPADADKAMPHHHGGCHGDHVAAPSERAAPGRVRIVRADRFRAIAVVRPRSTADPALRPPQA